MSSTPTPLRDAWNAYKDNLDTSREYKNIRELNKGDYVLIVNDRQQAYTGEVASVGKLNVKVNMPYGGWGDSDFKCMQEIKFPKSQVVKFYKPKANG